MNEDIRRLIAYRLDQAEETLDAARELSATAHHRDAVNRACYAMFYSGLALLALKGLGASKHSGVLSGTLSKRESSLLSMAATCARHSSCARAVTTASSFRLRWSK